MPQKRGEVVKRVDASEMMPDIYENWLKKQESRDVEARSGFIGDRDIKPSEQEDEDEQENEIDRAEDVHEKAHRRKRGKSS
jgi:hypothetical protein